MIETRHTDGSSGELMAAFSAVPEAVYREDPVWAPESESAIVECLEDAAAGAVTLSAVVALAGDRPVARAMALLDSGTREAAVPAEGRVGLFECVEGFPEAGTAVLGHCERWLRSQGAARAVAPRVDALRSGLLIDGFERPHSIFTAHNPPYYLGLFTAAGYEISTRMRGYVYSRRHVPSLPGVSPEGVRVRHPDLSRPREELARLEAFQAEVFGGSLGFVARDGQGSGRLLGRLLPIMDPELAVIAEDEVGGTIGFLLCLPDVWQRRRPVDRARWVSAGVAPGWRRRGVGLAMGVVLLERLLAKGYQTLDGSWVMESNDRAHLLAGMLGGESDRVFALLGKEL